MTRNDMLFWISLAGLAINAVHRGHWLGALCGLVGCLLAFALAPGEKQQNSGGTENADR